MPGFRQTGGLKDEHDRPCAMASLALVLFGPCVDLTALAQKTVSNLDESKVRPYTLPDPLVVLRRAKGRDERTSGTRSGGPSSCTCSRPTSMARCPQPRQTDPSPSFMIKSEDRAGSGWTAIRREVTIEFSEKAGRSPDRPLALPAQEMARPETRVPAFLGMNFRGNHTIDA